MKSKNSKSLGFTLIELMIVVVILANLAAIAIPNFLYFQAKSKRTEAYVILYAVSLSETAYHVEKEEYFFSNSYIIRNRPIATAPKFYSLVELAGSPGFESRGFGAWVGGNIDGDPFLDQVVLKVGDPGPVGAGVAEGFTVLANDLID